MVKSPLGCIVLFLILYRLEMLSPLQHLTTDRWTCPSTTCICCPNLRCFHLFSKFEVMESYLEKSCKSHGILHPCFCVNPATSSLSFVEDNIALTVTVILLLSIGRALLLLLQTEADLPGGLCDIVHSFIKVPVVLLLVVFLLLLFVWPCLTLPTDFVFLAGSFWFPKCQDRSTIWIPVWPHSSHTTSCILYCFFAQGLYKGSMIPSEICIQMKNEWMKNMKMIWAGAVHS